MITEKKFNSCVLPGVLDVCANFDLFVTAFNSEDFPTLDLPKKATSGRLLISKPSIFATPFIKVQFLKNYFFYMLPLNYSLEFSYQNLQIMLFPSPVFS